MSNKKLADPVFEAFKLCSSLSFPLHNNNLSDTLSTKQNTTCFTNRKVLQQTKNCVCKHSPNMYVGAVGVVGNGKRTGGEIHPEVSGIAIN